jgi:hypothetical protein
LSAPNDNREFQQAAAAGRSGLFGEFWGFLKHNKKWWLLPIFVMLLAVGILAVLAGSSAAPFIYTLF